MFTICNKNKSIRYNGKTPFINSTDAVKSKTSTIYLRKQFVYFLIGIPAPPLTSTEVAGKVSLKPDVRKQ